MKSKYKEKIQEAADLMVSAADYIEKQRIEIERLSAVNLQLQDTIDSYARVLAETEDVSAEDKHRCGLEYGRNIVQCGKCRYAYSNSDLEKEQRVLCSYWTCRSHGLQVLMCYTDFCSKGVG